MLFCCSIVRAGVFIQYLLDLQWSFGYFVQHNLVCLFSLLRTNFTFQPLGSWLFFLRLPVSWDEFVDNLSNMQLSFKYYLVADNYRLQPTCEALLYEATVLRLWWGLYAALHFIHLNLSGGVAVKTIFSSLINNTYHFLLLSFPPSFFLPSLWKPKPLRWWRCSSISLSRWVLTTLSEVKPLRLWSWQRKTTKKTVWFLCAMSSFRTYRVLR